MDNHVRRLVAWGAILAPALHTLTDILEWAQGGFSSVQLWLNYVAFVPIPAVIIGLYAAQSPRISRLGLYGALCYGFAFVFFTHTTLWAITTQAATYDQLWVQLGGIYTLHGVLMVVGGLMFGLATLRAEVFSPWIARLFLLGIVINFVLALLPVTELLQTAGSALRNTAMVGMGLTIARQDTLPMN